MNILVLGIGLQGKASVFDLASSPDISHVLAADLNLEDARAFVDHLGSDKVEPVLADAADRDQVRKLMQVVQAVIVFLPPAYRLPMARLAVECGIHFVDASYALPEYDQLSIAAEARGVALLPECGLDPGIDLVLAGQGIKEFDYVEAFRSYGAGIPEPAAADNPLQYKISWTFSGVLDSYMRPARIIDHGRVMDIAAGTIFRADRVHRVLVDGLGELEAYPNGDAVRYVTMLGIANSVKDAGRYSLRWPGHSDFWQKLADLGFLDHTPIQVGHNAVVPRRFLHDLLHPQLAYAAGERDIAVVRVELQGKRDRVPKRIVYQVVDYRDLETGFLAMQRTVGFTASICTQMILRDEIKKRGLLSPLLDIPGDEFFSALGRRGIQVQRTEDS